MNAPARYFPVTEAPLKMTAGLKRLGTDFGHGARDAQLFQVDDERPRYLAEKRAAPPERHQLAGTDAAAEAARAAGLACMREALAREAPALLAEADADRAARSPLEAIARAVQEDFAIFAADDGDGRTVALDVRFPSGWRPERLAGASFVSLHAPVPGFVDTPAAARSMVDAMVSRGPYVRFVWTVCSDAALDHHPDARPPVQWDVREARDAWRLRVERQVTVPLPAARASLFLIRTYLYPLHALSEREQRTLLRALEVMPEAVRAYKGLPQAAVIAPALPHARP